MCFSYGEKCHTPVQNNAAWQNWGPHEWPRNQVISLCHSVTLKTQGARDLRTVVHACGFDRMVMWNVTGCGSQRHREPSPHGVHFSFFFPHIVEPRGSVWSSCTCPVVSPCPWLLLPFCPILLGSLFLCRGPCPSRHQECIPGGREGKAKGHRLFQSLSF